MYFACAARAAHLCGRICSTTGIMMLVKWCSWSFTFSIHVVDFIPCSKVLNGSWNGTPRNAWEGSSVTHPKSSTLFCRDFSSNRRFRVAAVRRLMLHKSSLWDSYRCGLPACSIQHAACSVQPFQNISLRLRDVTLPHQNQYPRTLPVFSHRNT